MRVVVREQPFNRGVYRIEVRRDRFLKVYVRHYLPHHWCKRDTPIHDVLAHFLLARFALHPVFVENGQRRKFAPAHPRIEQYEQCARRAQIRVVLTELHELLFFLIGKRFAFFRLIFRQYDFRHRRIEFEIARG